MRIPIRAMRIRAMAVRVTWIRGHLRRARMATTPLIPTDVHLTATMDLAGSRAESLLASDLGAGVDAASMVDEALAGGATMEADGPSLDPEDSEVGTVAVTPVGADVASVAVGVPLGDVPTGEGGVPTGGAEAEAVFMVVGVGRVRANPKLSRPTAFAVGRLVSRQVPPASSRTIL